MLEWRVCKYNPLPRDSEGRYQREEWTSVHDIGRSFGGVPFKVAEYLRVEDAYIDVAMAAHADAGGPLLRVRGLETVELKTDVPGDVVSAPLVEDQLISRGELPVVMRSCLRELMWCRLESEDATCMIHFGYDYYVYLVGMPMAARTREIAGAAGLFVQYFRSPYIQST